MHTRVVLVLAFVMAMVVAAPARAETPAARPAASPHVRALVTLVTLGTFPRHLADAVEHNLREELQVDVRRIDAVPLPKSAYYPPRERYRADRLLEFLHTLVPDGPGGQQPRILGLTDVDISTTKAPYKDWGVFGLGEIGGASAVISIFRLQRGARDPAHLQFRTVGVAVHEIGHTLGLPHCEEPRCVMLDAEGSIKNLDTSTGRLEPGCRAVLERESPLVPPTPAH